MHELSIALSILELAQEEAERRHATRVDAIHVKLGPLSGVVPAALLNAYELARETSPFSDCPLIINQVPITARCPACAVTQTLASMQDLRCPVCGTPTPEILTGRELELSAMEIVT